MHAGGEAMDTVDIVMRNIKVDTKIFNNYFKIDQVFQKSEKTNDYIERETVFATKEKLKNLKINFIGKINSRKIENRYNIYLIKVSIPKLLGCESNRFLINNQRKINSAFNTLVNVLKNMGIQCTKKEIEFTRIDFPVHIETEEFDSWKSIFNMISMSYGGKHYQEPRLTKLKTTGILFNPRDGIEVNIYNKKREQSSKKTKNSKNHIKITSAKKKVDLIKQMIKEDEGPDTIRVETRFIGKDNIKKTFGSAFYKDISLNMIRENVSLVFSEIKDEIFKNLAIEVCPAEIMLQKNKNSKKSLETCIFLNSQQFNDVEVLLTASERVYKNENKHTFNSKRKIIRQSCKYLSQVTGDYYNNFSKLEKLFRAVLGYKIKSKDEFLKALNSDEVYELEEFVRSINFK